MRHYSINNDPMEGMTVTTAQSLVASIRSHSLIDGEWSISEPDSSGTYHIGLVDTTHCEMLERYLNKRGIDYRVLDQTPQEPMGERPSECGVIFFHVDASLLSMEEAFGARNCIAQTFAMWNGGELVVRSGTRSDGDGYYYVGFNMVTAGKAFATLLNARDVPIEYHDTLPDGSRPNLKLTDYRNQSAPMHGSEPTPQPSGRRRRRTANQTAGPEERRGFAQMAALLRSKASDLHLGRTPGSRRRWGRPRPQPDEDES